MKIRQGQLGALTVVAATFLAVAHGSTADAARKPTATERAALAQAMEMPRRCLRIRIATVRTGWASVRLRSPLPDSCLKYAADGVSVWRKRDDVWRQRFAGSSWSCPIPGVPEDVRKDLRLGYPEGGP
jgi:hypothetical protein